MKFKTTWESKSILGLALLAFFAKQTVSINSAWAFILTFGGCNLSCYIHAVRNCGGLSLCDLCYASLLTMSISARIVVAVTFHEVDHAPDTEACTECDYECLKYAYCAVEKCHIRVRNPNPRNALFCRFSAFPTEPKRYISLVLSLLNAYLRSRVSLLS